MPKYHSPFGGGLPPEPGCGLYWLLGNCAAGLTGGGPPP